jgi:twitching motility protein PilT
MARLDALLRQLRDDGGSDLHLAAGLVPRMRRRGHVEEVAGQGVLDDPTLRGLLAELASEAQWREFETSRDRRTEPRRCSGSSPNG